MKELLFALKILELISVLGIANKIVVKSINPQTYTSYCTYSEEEVINEDRRLLSQNKHIVICSNSDCEYRKKINFDSKIIEIISIANVAIYFSMMGGIILIMVKTFGVASTLAFGPFVLAIILIPTFLILVFGYFFVTDNAEKNLKKIEAELEERWENQQVINNLRIENEQKVKRIEELEEEVKYYKGLSEAQVSWYRRLLEEKEIITGLEE